MINSFLTELYTGDSLKALQIVENATRSGSLDRGQSFLLRLAILKHGQSFLYYQKLYNLWTNLGKPHLKPNATKQKLVLLTDFTADSLPPLLSIFCAAQGVEIEVLLSDFDSIEQTLLNQNSSWIKYSL